MSIELFFDEKPTKETEAIVDRIALSSSYGSIFQYSPWLNVHRHEYDSRMLFSAKTDQELVAGSLLLRKPLFVKFAEIQFGPLIKQLDNLVDIFAQLVDYCGTHYHWLKVSLPYSICNETEILERWALKSHNMQFDFQGSNWTTLSIDLTDPPDVIYRNFRRNHKQCINKAEKKFYVQSNNNNNDIIEFAKLYNSMYLDQGIKSRIENDVRYYLDLHALFSSSDCGKFYLVKDADRVLGGAVCVRSGNRYIYFKGASDPKLRKEPVSHLAIWEALKDAYQLCGVDIFDLGGYNIFSKDTDRVYYINHFKKGFGGRLEIFPKTQYYIFDPIRYQLYKKAILIKSRIKKLIKR